MKLDRVQQKQWDQLVKQAREHIKNYNKEGLAIAELALKACDILHGGGQHWDSHAGMLTLTRFAVDIGMRYKTLHYWVCLKRDVLSKLPNAAIEGDRGALRRTQRQVSKNASPAEVAAVYQRELQRHTGEIALIRYQTSLRRLSGLLGKEKLTFAAADLTGLHKLALELVQTIEKRLKLQRKRA
jgi:hypothetical protein